MKSEMNIDSKPEETNLERLLLMYSIIFAVGSGLAAYFFLIDHRATSLQLLFAPLVMAMISVACKISSSGVRSNHIFLDLVFISFISIGIYALIRLSLFVIYFEFSLTYFISALTSFLLLIPIMILWKKAVIARFGLHTLAPTEALSYRALAEVVIGDYKPAGYSFDTCVIDFDNYLTSIKSRQKMQVKLVYLVLQIIPLVFMNIPFTWMGVDKRKQFMKRRFYKSSGMLLTLMRSAKQLVYFIDYGGTSSFESTGYVMFENRDKFKKMIPEPEPEELRVSYLTSTCDIRTDICVIGSGAAGAVVAYELAKKTGKNVIILDRGRYYVPQKDFSNIESEMIGTLYRDGGLEMTQDFDLAVLQGICVGGSTVVNNGICFRTPHPVLVEWEKLGAKIDVERLEGCFAAVEETIKAKNLDSTKVNEGANRFFAGATKLGLNPSWFKTNFDECGGAGYCNLGCKYNRKMSMLLTYLPLALRHGGQIIADAEVKEIQTNGNKAERLICRTANGTRFTVSANHFVVAAGAIASSMLLLKSGIRRNVGSRLSFNVTTPMMAEVSDPLNSFDGVEMCCYVEGDGFLVETTFNPPGASAVIMQGWFETLNERMKNYTHYATAAPVVGSEPNGYAKLSLLGNPVIDYEMTAGDFKKLKAGMKTLCRIFLASGAKSVLPASYDDLVICSESDCSRIDREIKKPQDISLSSAHPQGGNPMSDRADIGVVDSNFRVHGFKNLYVCDASIFPTGVKVNPQLSIMGIARYAADAICANM